MGETIREANVKDMYISDMQTYAIALNRKQSVPDVKDGLKSVDRRVLIDMFKDKHLLPNKPYIKSAGTVGSTMEKYHAHGDSSIYDVLCKLASWWKVKLPLIDGHGNYGNMQGDGAAAMRYTESRLSEFGYEAVIGNLAQSKDVVDWTLNFDESTVEPCYLPAKVPLLLINGTFGIGIGMRTEISSHNPGEVIQAAIDVLKDPEAPVVLIPDHRTPCDIVDTNWKKICNTGFGSYRCRARIDIEEVRNKKGELVNSVLVIKSIPDNVTLSNTSGLEDKGIIATIEKLKESGKISGIKDMYDDTKGDNLRYCIVLDNQTNPNFLREFLYKHTNLEKTFRENFEVLDDITPMRLSYKAYIEFFIDFSIKMRKRTYYALRQAAVTESRRKDLYIKLIESGDIADFQAKIRKLKNVTPEAKNEFIEKIIKKYNCTDIEAKYVLEMDQMKAAIGNLPIYKKEKAELDAKAEEYWKKLTEPDNKTIKKEIIKELEYFKAKYGGKRICRVVKDTGIDIPPGEFLVVITENNRVRKMTIGGNVNSVRGDNPKFVLKIDNTENLLLYDKNGKIFKLPVHKINLCDKSNPGQDLRILIKNCTSDIIMIMNEASLAKLANTTTQYFLTVLTDQGCIKKMNLEDFLNVPPSGILYTKLSPGDTVNNIAVLPDSVDIVVYNKKKALRFELKQVPHYKRSALGVISIAGGNVDGFAVLDPKNTEYIIVVTTSGKINKFSTSGLSRGKRNQAGSSIIKLDSGDSIHSILGVKDSDVLLIGSQSGVTEVNVSDIKSGSTISKGKKVIPVRGDKIIDIKIK